MITLGQTNPNSTTTCATIPIMHSSASGLPSSTSFAFLPTTTTTTTTTTTPKGRNPHLFQPPNPAATSTSDYFARHPRKRARAPSQISTTTVPYWQQNPTPSEASSTCFSSAGLVDERYTLHNGRATPAGMLTDYDDEEEEPRALYFGPLARERNGGSRSAITSSHNKNSGSGGWTGLAFSFVGKVFDFGGRVLKGFYAVGGGTGYALPPPSPACRGNRGTPLPGAWKSDEEFLHDDDDDDDDDEEEDEREERRPALKRRQTGRETWVFVSPHGERGRSSPRRKKPTTRTASHAPLRPSLTRNSSSRRISAATASRRQSSQHNHSQSQPLYPNSPRVSTASLHPRTPSQQQQYTPLAEHDQPTYISPEAASYIRRRRARDRAAEASMTDMSRRLAVLIREGQEALGTRVEVEDEGGYEEEGW